MKTMLYPKTITHFSDKLHIIILSRPKKNRKSVRLSPHVVSLLTVPPSMLYFISCIIHTHTENTQLQPLTANPPVPPHPPAVAPAVSAQRQAKCMLMRARPMVEPHSFWEEMAFNNGGPRGDFAQSSAPLWKIHSIHCCACTLLLSCSLFHQKKGERERSQNTFVVLSPLYLCWGTEELWGTQRALIFLYYTISESVYCKTPSCTSSVPLSAFVFVPVSRQVSPEEC